MEYRSPEEVVVRGGMGQKGGGGGGRRELKTMLSRSRRMVHLRLACESLSVSHRNTGPELVDCGHVSRVNRPKLQSTRSLIEKASEHHAAPLARSVSGADVGFVSRFHGEKFYGSGGYPFNAQCAGCPGTTIRDRDHVPL